MESAQLGDRARLECALSREHFVEHEPEREDVAPCRDLASRELLRRATGEELRVEPWLGYLEGKLLDAGLLTEPVRLPRT